MSRPLRIEFPGALYHVTARGDRREPVLYSTHGFTIEAARLETDGKGESQPLAENSSAVNKAKNRRVEFINLKGDAKPTINTQASTVPGTAGAPVVPADAKTYKSVKIGAQTWMAENLNVSRFKNGDPIPEAKTNEEWVKAAPAWSYYNNDPKNEAKYGKLYNWYAMVNPIGLTCWLAHPLCGRVGHIEYNPGRHGSSRCEMCSPSYSL